jgi:TraM recognition site of TraD and TraG
MANTRPQNATAIEKFFFDLSDGKIGSSIQYQEYFTPQNIAYFIIGLILLSVAITLLFYFLLFIFHSLRVTFDKINKKPHFLRISFNKQINYNNASYLQVMDNLIKRLEQIIRVGGNSVSLEVHKNNGRISFIASCSNKKALEGVKAQLKSIEGLKIEDVDHTVGILNESSFVKSSRIKKVYYKPDSEPISFKTQNVFSDIVKALEKSENNSGCIILFRSSKARNRLIGFKRRFDMMSKDPKRNDQYINQEKSKLIEDKVSHGELMNVRIYVYSQDPMVADNLASCFAQSNLNNDIRSSNVFLPMDKSSLINRYIAPEFVPLRAILGYSYLSSFELAHIFRPVFSEQMILMDQNIVTIPEKASSDLLLLNKKGDSIKIEDGKNGIGIFGDKGSGKTSGALGNLIVSSFNNGEGALFTTYKAEEVYPILKLAKQNNRLDDVILLNRDSLWRTNIINEELKQTKSIDNAIDLLIKINAYVNKTEKATNTLPFWDNQGRKVFNNLISLTLFLNGKFSFSIFEYLGELMSESARFYDSQGAFNLTPDQMKQYKERELKKLTFDAILKLVEDKEYKEGGQLFDFNQDDVKNCVKFFKVSWLGEHKDTREGIYSTFESNIGALKKGIIPKLLMADVDESYSHYFTFGDTRKGKIIILDEPISLRGNEGKTFQKTIKSFWIDEIKRSDKIKPSNLISDEYQELVTEDDIDFLNVCRSYGVGIIWATQNVATLDAKLGKDRTKQLLANTQVKIFHQSSDPLTWKYGRELLGEVDSNNYTEQYNEKLSTSITSSQKFELLGKHFQQLSMNLPASQTEAIIFNKGYNFEDGKLRYLEVIFNKVDRILESEVEDLIPQISSSNLPLIDVQNEVKNLLISGGVSELGLESKQVQIKPKKSVKKTMKKDEEESSSGDQFLSINDLVYKFNTAERTLRQKIKGANILVENKDIKSDSGQKIKVYKVADIEKLLANPVKEMKLENSLTL